MNTINISALATLFAILLMGNASPAATISETEPNNSLAGAQSIDGSFTLDYDPDIKDSTVMPHVSILGEGEGRITPPAIYTYDYYRFTVTVANSQAVFDVDYAYKPGQSGSADSTIALWDSAGNPLIEEDNTWGDCMIDPGGSACYHPAGQSERLLDPFLQYTFVLPGQYMVGIAESATISDPAFGGWYYNNPSTGDITNPLDIGDT